MFLLHIFRALGFLSMVLSVTDFYAHPPHGFLEVARLLLMFVCGYALVAVVENMGADLVWDTLKDDSSLAADLLGAALDEVNWDELYDAYHDEDEE